MTLLTFLPFIVSVTVASPTSTEPYFTYATNISCVQSFTNTIKIDTYTDGFIQTEIEYQFYCQFNQDEYYDNYLICLNRIVIKREGYIYTGLQQGGETYTSFVIPTHTLESDNNEPFMIIYKEPSSESYQVDYNLVFEQVGVFDNSLYCRFLKSNQLNTSGIVASDDVTLLLPSPYSDVTSFEPLDFGYMFDNLFLERLETNFVTEPSYQDGYDSGYRNGLSDGYDNGYTAGHQEGYSQGYNEGINQDMTIATIFSGCLSVAMVPINFFLAIFNFEILGINIADFVSALLSVCIVIIIVRIVLGVGNNGSSKS